MTDIKTLCEMIEEIAKDFCLNFCKCADECEKLEAEGKELRPCPLDKIGN